MTTKAEALENIPNVEKSRKIGNNTFEYYQDGCKKIRLHNTDILTFQKNGSVIYNSGGWKTPTTKDRLNNFGLPDVRIYQEKSKWYITSRGDESSLFYDGIVIDKNGKIKNPKKADKKTDALLKKINAYCLALSKLKELPTPGPGDCWHCSMFEPITTPGQKLKDTSHLISHLNEKYIHGSLIVNSLIYAGYNNPGFIFQMDARKSIVSSVRNFFKSQLSIAR